MPTVRRATPDELPAILALRHDVFVLGQGVPVDLEADGLDPVAVQVVALADDGVPCGTARMRTVDGHAKFERVAVGERWRGLGIGVALMHELEVQAAAAGLHDAVLNAQASVVDFYAKLGWSTVGPVFWEAGIPHQKMAKKLA
jgi:predicted GNAT family N-acyltransferase